MTKNQQLTIGIVVLAVIVLYLMQDVKQKAQTIDNQNARIDAQRAELSRASFAWQQENQRANQHATESNRKSVEIASLKEQLREISAGGSAS
jgi:uncharacterized protein (DUF3084 family)